MMIMWQQSGLAGSADFPSVDGGAVIDERNRQAFTPPAGSVAVPKAGTWLEPEIVRRQSRR
jgi:hypothetical protein